MPPVTKCPRCGNTHISGDFCDDGYPPRGATLIFPDGSKQVLAKKPPRYPLWRKAKRVLRRIIWNIKKGWRKARATRS